MGDGLGETPKCPPAVMLFVGGYYFSRARSSCFPHPPPPPVREWSHYLHRGTHDRLEAHVTELNWGGNRRQPGWASQRCGGLSPLLTHAMAQTTQPLVAVLFPSSSEEAEGPSGADRKRVCPPPRRPYRNLAGRHCFLILHSAFLHPLLTRRIVRK